MKGEAGDSRSSDNESNDRSDDDTRKEQRVGDGTKAAGEETADEKQRMTEAQIKAILVSNGTEKGMEMNRYDFLENVLFEILAVQAEHLTSLIE